MSNELTSFLTRMESTQADFTDMLDELVHECKAEEAANINNAGPTDQVQYLYEQGHSLVDIATELDLEL